MKRTFLVLALVAGMNFSYVNAQSPVYRPHDVNDTELNSFVTKNTTSEFSGDPVLDFHVKDSDQIFREIEERQHKLNEATKNFVKALLGITVSMIAAYSKCNNNYSNKQR